MNIKCLKCTKMPKIKKVGLTCFDTIREEIADPKCTSNQ